MLALAARQCPHCVLRFGSSSELDQHLRLDHRSAKGPEPTLSIFEPHDDDRDSQATDLSESTRRPLLGLSVLAALIALVAIVSWHVAALMSAGLAVAVAIQLARPDGTSDSGSELPA